MAGGTSIKVLIVAGWLLGLSAGLSSAACSLDKDEDVIFYPTSAYQTGEGWAIPIHGCILKTGPLSRCRRLLTRLLIESVDLSKKELAASPFERRAKAFLASEVLERPLSVMVGPRIVLLPKSFEDGQFFGTLMLSNAEADSVAVPPGRSNRWISYRLTGCADDSREFKGKSLLPAAQGISVISDIDDTIKVTNVRVRKQMLANTFLHNYLPVPGMTGLYSGWATKNPNYVFYYVSASPWQIFGDLEDFLKKEKFPPGVLVLKRFRASGRQLWSLFESPQAYKLPVLRDLFKRYPHRHFILVGDSGERDPEIYGILAREYPRQVLHIYIRDLGDKRARFAAAFQNVMPLLWTVFKNPEGMPS